MENEEIIVPVVEEILEVQKRTRATGRVVLHKRVHETSRTVDEPTLESQVHVERVPVGIYVSEPPAVRIETGEDGEVTVFPVVEEILVVEKRLLLKEEVRVSRRLRETRNPKQFPLRSETIEISRKFENSDPEPKTKEKIMTQAMMAMFERQTDANEAIRALREAGIPPDDIQISADLPEPAQNLGEDKSAWEKFKEALGFDVPEEDQRVYSHGLNQGGYVVSVQTRDTRVSEAEVRGIFERCGAIDLDERFGSLGTGADTGATATGYTTATTGATTESQVVVPVAEEELAVGKRMVERGRVRVYSRVIETPVQETVQLRDEQVSVERRVVDRPISPDAVGAFQDGQIELTETAEEAIVEKRARIVEEVVVGKQVSQHQETIRDTLRSTDVDVERIESDLDRRPLGESGIPEAAFRAYHGEHFGGDAADFEPYAPAYAFGHQLGLRRELSAQEWDAVETRARSEWEREHEGPWERFKDAVRYAWQRARGSSASSGTGATAH